MQKMPIRMWIVSRGHNKVKSVFLLLFYFRDDVGCHFKKINENKNIYRWLYYTKYKAEYNALLTIYAKYSPKIYWEVWKFESGKVWNF